MCFGDIRKEDPDKKGSDEITPRVPQLALALRVQHEDNYVLAQIIRRFGIEDVRYTVMCMYRLMQDPYYHLMNVSPASRIWMFRNLLTLHVDLQGIFNLLQLFEELGREAALIFLRQENAPEEMINQWDKTHPANNNAVAVSWDI